MSLLKLKAILGRKNDTSALIQSFVEQTGQEIGIADTQGNVLLGVLPSGAVQQIPVTVGDDVLGWVWGGAQAGLIAQLLSVLAQKESERRKLGSEVLSLYQELNIIFDFSEKLAQAIEPEVIARMTLEQATHSIRADSGVVVLWDETDARLTIPAYMGEPLFDKDKLSSKAYLLLRMGLHGQSEIVGDLSALAEAGIIGPGVRSLMYAALKVKHRIMGAIILAGSDPDLYTAANLKLLVTLALQSSAAIESALLYEKNIREVREREEAILRIHEVTMKFVPSAFIRSLGKEVITDVKLGDQIEKEVTVLFTDIRDFTTLSEQMTPGENFLFVSSFNETMGPIIRNHGGFVNQYLGDSIMAIFPDDPRHALDAAVAIQKRLIEFNRDRLEKGQTPIRIGIGMHTGSLIMGITGDEHRLDAATISDTVNTAARIESLTKYFKSPILLSDATLEGIKSRADLHLRFLGKVQLKGKYNLLGIHECFNGLSEPECSRRVQSLPLFDEGLNHYMNREFNEAITAFEQILRSDPADQTTRNLLEHARRNARNGVPDNWTGVLEMSSK